MPFVWLFSPSYLHFQMCLRRYVTYATLMCRKTHQKTKQAKLQAYTYHYSYARLWLNCSQCYKRRYTNHGCWHMCAHSHRCPRYIHCSLEVQNMNNEHYVYFNILFYQKVTDDARAFGWTFEHLRQTDT